MTSQVLRMDFSRSWRSKNHIYAAKKRLFLHFFLATAFLAITSTAFFLLSSSRTQADIPAPSNIITAQAVITAQSLITDGANAIDLLGQYDDTSLTDPQPNYANNSVNNGPNQFGFNQIEGLAQDPINHRLFVSDYNNNRVLIYNLNTDNTLTDHIPDNVLGQTNFNSATNTVSTTNQASTNGPQGLAYDPVNNRLFVAQNASDRVSVFDVTTINNGENAISVLGQSSFTSNDNATSQSGMYNPFGLAYDSTNQRLFVSEYNNIE